jgi:putative transposase
MKRTRTKPEAIINILREAETSEQPLAEFCRKHGVSEETFYRWRRRFDGMDVSQAKQLRELAAENARLKKLLAERDLEVDALQRLVGKKL